MAALTRWSPAPCILGFLGAGLAALAGCAQIAEHERARRDRAQELEQAALDAPQEPDPTALVVLPGEAQSTLIRAAGLADLATVVRMLNANVPVNGRAADGDTALGAAARARSREIARRLLTRGADPNRSDRFGNAPLVYAVRNGDATLVDMLLRAGADVNARETLGYPLLARAVLAGDPQLLARLLRARPAPDLAAHDREGYTALHHAVLVNRADLARQLLDAGAPRGARDRDDKTPLFWALTEGHEDLALLLLENGADPGQRVNGQDMAYYAVWGRAERAAAAIAARARR
jgi:ankyrin repeat protein